jgi:hypothetical protein
MLLDIKTQPMMFGNTIVEELQVKEMDLKLRPFTIATSFGFIEHAIGLTKEPIHLEFKVGHNEITHFKCNYYN